MKVSVLILGILLALAGAATIAYGEYTPLTGTTTTSTTSTSTIVPSTNRVIDANGIWSSGGVVVKAGEVVSGTFTVSNYSASKGHIFFYVMNETQFSAWGPCFPCSSSSLKNYTSPASGTMTFTWTAPKSDQVLFVFDDGVYNAAAQATFTANGQASSSSVLATTAPNWTIIYAGSALLIVGAVALAAGVLMSGKKPAMAPASPS